MGLKYRSKIQILHWITQFSLSHVYGENSFGGLISGAFCNTEPPELGDLVTLNSAPPTQFYLGWYLGQRKGKDEWQEHCVESIEDASRCWWRNVGISFLNRDTVKQHPSWRWTDRQHEFNDRWFRTVCKQPTASSCRPVEAEFIGEHGVILSVRMTFDLSPCRSRVVCNDWRKVTVRDMVAFYNEAVAELGIT